MRNQREQIVKHKILTLPNNSLNPQDSLTTLFIFISKFAQFAPFADKNALK